MRNYYLSKEKFEEVAAALGWHEERRWALGSLMVEKVPYDTISFITGRTSNALYCDVKRAWQEIEGYDARQRGEEPGIPVETLALAGELHFAIEYETGFSECIAAVRIIVPGHWKYTKPLTAKEERERQEDVKKAHGAEQLRKLGLVPPETPFLSRKLPRQVDNSFCSATE